MGKKIGLLVAVYTVLLLLLFSGCGQGYLKNGSSGSTPSEISDNVKHASKEQLEKYVDQLPALTALFERHHVKFLSSYSSDAQGFLEVRRVGEHTGSLSDEEKAALKQSIYNAVGGEFPLNISVFTTDEEQGVTGKITAIDNEGRLLIVSSDRFLDDEKKKPDAAWYAMADDADIKFEDKPLQIKDVKIGSSVKVWSEGLMLLSYPGQTTGLRLEITTLDNGNGDTAGKVTGLETTGEGVNEMRVIEVNGMKYILFPFARIRIKDEISSFTDIKVGDHVKLWFAGYDVGPEKIVTQVVGNK